MQSIKRIVRGRRKDRSDWGVLLVDHHEGYLSWADFERSQRLNADNANGKGKGKGKGKGMMVRGPVRKGDALLAGLLRCSHCGRRLLSVTMAPRAMLAAISVTRRGVILTVIPVSRLAHYGLLQGLRRTGPQERQFELAHRPFHAQPNRLAHAQVGVHFDLVAARFHDGASSSSRSPSAM
nr:hypothetical protein [Mesorhizobium sp. LNJC384A00]